MTNSVTFKFSGAHVLIVGASRAGIGAAIARSFEEAGANVAITGAEPEPAPGDRGRFTYTQLDVTDLGAVRTWVRHHQWCWLRGGDQFGLVFVEGSVKRAGEI